MGRSGDKHVIDDRERSLAKEVASLRRQIRFLQIGVVAVFGCLLMAAVAPSGQVLKARGLVIEDRAGRERIVLGDASPDESTARGPTSETLVFKGEGGQNRVLLGQEPNPRINGEDYRRVAQGWGMVIYDPSGDERGGFGYLDGRGASIAVDRPTGDALGMLVDEKSGLAAFALNYDNKGKLGSYPTALEVATKGGRAFIEAHNEDGSSAGTLIASGQGRARVSGDTAMDAR